MAISQDTIHETQMAADIVSVVGEYTVLTRRGGNDWWGCCPFHNERTASFHVDGDKKFYYCFGCHAGGDVIKFVMEMEKLSYSEAILQLAKKNGIEVRYTGGNSTEESERERESERRKDAYIDLYERVAGLFNYLLTQSTAGKGALEYIRKRGLTDATIAEFRLGYAPREKTWLKKFLLGKKFSDEFLSSSGLFSKKYPNISFFSDRLMFPITDRRGKCIAFGARLLNGDGPKYLNSGDMMQYKKGDTLYAFGSAKKAMRAQKRVIFCEGYMDCIAYHQCGVTFAVAPLGTALTEDQVKSVRTFVDTVLLSFDSDEAGVNATKKAIIMCRKMGLAVKVVMLDGGKDPAEIMLKYGRDVLTKYVESSILDADFLLYRLGQEYATDMPDGKTRACLAFFDYVDALQQDVLREASLTRLAQSLSLSVESVKADYVNRDATKRILGKQQMGGEKKNNVWDVHSSKRSEISAVFAVCAHMDHAKEMTEVLRAEDFSDEVARKVFCVLKECTDSNESTLGDVLSRLAEAEDEGEVPVGVGQEVANVLSRGEYAADDAALLVKDVVSRIKREALRRTGASMTGVIERLDSIGDTLQVSRVLEDKMKVAALSRR